MQKAFFNTRGKLWVSKGRLMVIVQIKGGVGNQMFQYIQARSVAEKCGLELKLNLHFPSSKHKFRLDGFKNIEYILAREKEISFKNSRLGRKINKMNIVLVKKGMRPIGKVWLTTHYQGERYFQYIKPRVKEIFKFKPLQSEAAHRIKLLIQEQSAPVALHVRLGDYLDKDNAPNFKICTPDYYLKAMELMKSRFSAPLFFVFSDNIQMCKQFLKDKRIFCVEDCDSEMEELHLMTLCRHYIISNSTFSWWGAWLGEDACKFVIVPYRWFKLEKLNTAYMTKNRLVPDAWHRLRF